MQQLLRAGAVHFFAHNGFDLADDFERQRKVIVDAAADLADVAGAHQQFVTDDLGVGRLFFQRRDECLAPTHSNSD